MNDVAAGETELVLELVLPISVEQLWKGWTDSSVLVEWFTPKPWLTIEAEIEPEPGGIFRTVMSGPNGERNEGTGCVLEAVPNRKFSWTNALGPGFQPMAPPVDGFVFAAIVEFEPAARGSTYRATAKHVTPEDAATHLAMGFHDGWAAAIKQLVEYFS